MKSVSKQNDAYLLSILSTLISSSSFLHWLRSHFASLVRVVTSDSGSKPISPCAENKFEETKHIFHLAVQTRSIWVEGESKCHKIVSRNLLIK